MKRKVPQSGLTVALVHKCNLNDDLPLSKTTLHGNQHNHHGTGSAALWGWLGALSVFAGNGKAGTL